MELDYFEIHDSPKILLLKCKPTSVTKAMNFDEGILRFDCNSEEVIDEWGKLKEAIWQQ